MADDCLHAELANLLTVTQLSCRLVPIQNCTAAGLPGRRGPCRQAALRSGHSHRPKSREANKGITMASGSRQASLALITIHWSANVERFDNPIFRDRFLRITRLGQMVCGTSRFRCNFWTDRSHYRRQCSTSGGVRPIQSDYLCARCIQKVQALDPRTSAPRYINAYLCKDFLRPPVSPRLQGLAGQKRFPWIAVLRLALGRPAASLC